MTHTQLIQSLIDTRVLKTPRIIAAFCAINRKDFVPETLKRLAYEDEPLPIGEGQTISQPHTVAFMLELLEPDEGQTILDVGAGSGWQTALLAHIVGETGHVYGVELIPALAEQARKNMKPYDFMKKGIAKIIARNAEKGLLEHAPFDRIIAAASAASIPHAWKEQLKIGGRIVMPVKDSIWLFIRKSESEWDEREYPGFVFVPFITKTDGHHNRP